MDIIEKVDIPDDNDIPKLNTDIYQNSFILPSQSIINYDLTPLKFTDISNEAVESEKVPPFVENLIDFNKDDDMMMTNHASNNASANTIWVPADKHAQIAPNYYDDWIKTRSNGSHSVATVTRRRSVLSTLSFNAADDDSNSSESNTSDEDDEPVTPTTITLPSLPDAFVNNLKEERVEETNKEEANEQKREIALPCRQAKSNQQEKPLNQAKEAFVPERNVKEQAKRPLPINMTQTVMKAPDKLNADHNSKKDRRSWFSGLLHDLKKTSKPQKPKKAGLSGLFSRSTKKPEPISHHTKISNSAEMVTAQQPSTITSLSSSSKPTTKPKKKKLEPAVSKTIIAARTTSKPLPQRYPINTERAIYRLSHIKIGNPRRPLQQQVVISNMMYWYLSIQQQEQQQQQTYYYNQRQQVYFNNIYQATYQSFEPPTPGGGYHQHQPHFHSYPHYQQQYYINPSVQQIPSQYYTPPTTENPKNTSQNKKKKYKPVRNTHYDPLAAENSIGIQQFQ